MRVVKKPEDPLNTDEGQDLSMELNKSQKYPGCQLGLMAAGAVLAFTLKPKQAKTEPAPKN